MNIKKTRIRVLFVLFIFSIINFIIFYNTIGKLDQIKNDISKIQSLEGVHFGKQKLNTIRNSLKATYSLDRFKNLLFKKNEVKLEEIVILEKYLTDLFNYYIINLQQQGSIYWFLRDLENEKGLKFAEDVYLKFDIQNTKIYQSQLIELNEVTKDVFDQIYELPDDIYEIISNKKRHYYARQKDGDNYWIDLIQKYTKKSTEDFIIKFGINSFTILEPFVESLTISTRTLNHITDSIEKDILKVKNKTNEKYEKEKIFYFYILAILIFLQLLIVIIIFQKDFTVTFLDKNLLKKTNTEIF